METGSGRSFCPTKHQESPEEKSKDHVEHDARGKETNKLFRWRVVKNRIQQNDSHRQLRPHEHLDETAMFVQMARNDQLDDSEKEDRRQVKVNEDRVTRRLNAND